MGSWVSYGGMMENCENCKFWHDPHEDDTATYDNVGWCRRFPPRPFLYNVLDSVGPDNCHFPITGDADWCGEWKGKSV